VIIFCVCCVLCSSLMGQRWPAVLGTRLKKIHSFIHSLFAHISDVKQTNDRRYEHANERNVCKHDCLVHDIQKNPCTMKDNEQRSSCLSTSFVRSICWLNNGNTRPPTLCAGDREAPDEKLKINELGPKQNLVTVYNTRPLTPLEQHL